MNAAIVDVTTDRSTGIGASDAPAVLGLSPWRTPLEVFLEKTGRAAPQAESLPMRIGKALEPVVLEAFSERTGLTVARRQERIRCPRFPWRWATVDAVTGDALVEAKTSGEFSEWGDEGTDQIPRHYIVQVQHALACTGLALAYVPVLIAGRDFRLYEVARDESIIEAITCAERDFWARIERNDPPPLTSANDVRIRWPVDNGASVVASDEDLIRIESLRRLKADGKALQSDIEELELALKERLGEAASLIESDGTVLATWRASKAPVRLDTKALQAAHPELCLKFSKVGAPVRRFLLKE